MWDPGGGNMDMGPGGIIGTGVSICCCCFCFFLDLDVFTR